MSALILATPAFNFANIVRPLIGLGLIGTMIMVFQPLLTGLLRAALLVLKPRQSRDERKARDTLQAMSTLNRMARDCDDSDPSFAAELRMLAARG